MAGKYTFGESILAIPYLGLAILCFTPEPFKKVSKLELHRRKKPHNDL